MFTGYFGGWKFYILTKTGVVGGRHRDTETRIVLRTFVDRGEEQEVKRELTWDSIGNKGMVMDLYTEQFLVSPREEVPV